MLATIMAPAPRMRLALAARRRRRRWRPAAAAGVAGGAWLPGAGARGGRRGRGRWRRPRASAPSALATAWRSGAAACGSRRRTPASSRSPTAGPPGTARTSRRRARRSARTALRCRPLTGRCYRRALATLGAGSCAGSEAARAVTIRAAMRTSTLLATAAASPWSRSCSRPVVAASRARAPCPPTPTSRCIAEDIKFDKKAYAAPAGDVEVAYDSKGQQAHSMVLEDANGDEHPDFRLQVAPGKEVGRRRSSSPAGTYTMYLRHPRPRGRRHGRRRSPSVSAVTGCSASGLEEQLRQEPEDRPQHERRDDGVAVVLVGPQVRLARP